MHSIAIPHRLVLLTVALGSVFPVMAQQAPDAGRVLQELQPPALLLPKHSNSIEVSVPSSTPALPGGVKVALKQVLFTGNSVFADDVLQAAIGDVSGKTYDLASLRGLADQVSDFYRRSGYPFARALLPQQALADGKLQILVVEGKYGKVQALGDKDLAPSAQAFLSSLKPTDAIRSDKLERATLVLDDLPGIKVVPVIRPGADLGTGDLDVHVERERRFAAEVEYSNHGNRYTGEHLASTSLLIDSPFMLGDQINARGLYSDEGQWMGSLGYSLPLGTSGLRAHVGYAHTYYELAKDFAVLDATGTAKVSTLGLSYPVLRSQQANLTLATTFQHKRLNDKVGTAGSDDGKSSDALPIALHFDHRDSLGGQGVTYGALVFTPGKVDLGTSLQADDIASGRNSRGHFNKWNLELARLQATSLEGLSLFGRISAQWSNKNLDSSEKFALGGPSSVRAFPVSEGIGDEGWLAQFEVRYAVGGFSPYMFYDMGRVQRNAKPESMIPAVTDNRRSIAGAGTGVRYSEGPWSTDLAMAWRTDGGKPEADVAKRNPRVWLSVSYKF